MAGSNTSSVDMGAGYKLSHLATQQKNNFGSQANIPSSQQNATRKSTSAAAKAKAKKKAKIAKASRKKSK